MSSPKPTIKKFNERGKRPQTALKLSTKQNLDVKDEKTEEVPASTLPRDTSSVKPAASSRVTASSRITASPRTTASPRITPSQRNAESKSASKAPTANSRPASARKPPIKSIQSSIQATSSSSPRNVRGQQNVQKQKYIKMKKELKDKQGEMFNLYDAMIKLRDEMISAGVKDVEIPEEPKIMDAGFLGGGEDLTAAHKRIAQATGNKSEYLSALEEKLNSVSFWCFDLCQKAVAVNTSVLTELGHMGRDKLKVSDAEMHKTIEGLKKESHSLMQSLEKKRKSHNDTVIEVLQEMKALLQERESLKNNQKANFEEELAQVQSERNALAEKLKAEILKGKGKQAETESLLNNARQKIKEVESKVSSQENRIQGFHSQMRKFESQIRARDRAHAMRLNDVSETTKLLRESKQSLEKQKENLEQRLEDLRRIMNMKERKQEDTISRLNSRINELNLLLSTEKDEKHKMEMELETAIAEKIATENLKNEIELQKNEIEKKLNEANSALSSTNVAPGERAKGSKRTPQEEELWVQLQGTQVLLQSTQQTLAAVQEEKEKIEASLKNVMLQKKTEVSPQKTADEIVEKENMITKLNENIKSISAESEQKSRTISEMKRKMHELEKQLAVKYYFERSKSHGADFKQKAAEMENEFLKLQEQNSEMEKHIRELHAELQRKENEQIKALKDRDELIRVLKNKEKKQAEQIMDLWSLVQEHESAASTVCQDMSGKDAEIKDLQKILEIKQLQILRLEKLVRKQEEQLDRWGLQRTRQEARIAELENNLREKQRYSDYLFQNDDSSLARQEKSSNGVEKHTCRDCMSPWGKQQDYRYLDGKKIDREMMGDTEMMGREQFQRRTPEDQTITSSYIDSDWSHVTPYSDHKQSFNESDMSHSQLTPQSGHNKNPNHSKNMMDYHILDSGHNGNIDHISFTSPKTLRNIQQSYKNTINPWRPLYKRKNQFADQGSVPGCQRSENIFSNYPSEYNDVLVPEQCTMIYENGKEAWQFQDVTSDEGQMYQVYDDDIPTKPYLPSSDHSKGISKSHPFYSERHSFDKNRKQISKSDPTALNKAIPPYYSYQGHLGAIGDNIMIKNGSFPSYNVGFCKVCNGRLASNIMNVHQNYSEPNRELTQTCHPKTNTIESSEMFCNLSTNTSPYPQQEKYKNFPVAEVYEAGEMTNYFTHFGDESVNIGNQKRKKYLNCGIHMPETVTQGCRKGLNDLLNSPVILCASPSAVLLLNCPYITNYLLHSPQLLKNKSVKYGTNIIFNGIDH